MLTLVLPEKELDNASIPVRWCLEAESLNQVLETGLTPYILITVSYERYLSKETTYRYPLDRYMAYIPLNYPGKVYISGCIVVVEDNNEKAIDKVFNKNTYDGENIYPHSKFVTRIWNRTKRFDDVITVTTFDQSDFYEITVKDDMFGAELPDWAKYFINRYWYENKPKDQCSQRRRILAFPFTTLPFVLFEWCIRVTWNLISSLFGWLLLLGVPTKFIIQPFKYGFIDWKDELFTYPFFYTWVLPNNIKNKINSEDSLKVAYTILMLPLIPLMNIILMALVGLFIDSDDIFNLCIASIGWYYVMIGVVVGIGLLCSLLIIVSNNIKSWLSYRFPKLIEWISYVFWYIIDLFLKLIDKLLPTPKTNDQMKAYLICPHNDASCLPKVQTKDKSFWLIFSEWKNKVCKPMRG